MASPRSLPKPFFLSREEFKEDATLAADFLTSVCFLVFIYLIGSDVCRAFRKRATWLPDKAFALSGVTVQIIVWWTSLSNILPHNVKEVDDLIYYHVLVVSGRVVVCVFIGYLLPGMTAPSVRVFGALTITICAQIASELLLLYNPTDTGSDSDTESHFPIQAPPPDIKRSKIVDQILFICIIVLGLILCCTILVSQTIRGLLRQRVSAIAEECKFQFSNEKMTISSCDEEIQSSNEKMTISSGDGEIQSSNEKTESTWDDFEGEVLRSCFIARVCQVDYVISRSVLSSGVWMVVTISVIVLYRSVLRLSVLRLVEWMPLMGSLVCFITMGWVVISWRWLTAQLYRPPRHSQRRWFYLEDFWTSHIVELIDIYDLKRWRRRIQKSKSKMSRSSKSQGLCTRIFTKFRLHKLLYLVVILQVCVVLLCKACGLLSELTVGEFVYWCRRFVHWCRKNNMTEDSVTSHENYAKGLECFCMPGEDLSSLWEANKMVLHKAKHLLKKGWKEGSSSDEINSIFSNYTMQWAKDGQKILNLLNENAIPSVLSHFPSVEKQCLKMTVVSLVTLYIEFHKAKSKSLTKVMKACSEVWDLVSFADERDIDLRADKINLLDDLNKGTDQVCMAANRTFYELQMKYGKLDCESEDCLKDKDAGKFLKRVLEECENKLKEENIVQGERRFPRDLSDSRNWSKLAPSYALYKLCKVMLKDDKKDFTSKDFVNWIEEALRHVIARSMSKLPDMIVKQCWVWAQEFDEDKLWEAIELAGKCRGMMEVWGQQPKTKVNNTQPKTLFQRFKMWILCRSVEEPPSQGDQTVSNTEQCTIEVKESPS